MTTAKLKRWILVAPASRGLGHAMARRLLRHPLIGLSNAGSVEEGSIEGGVDLPIVVTTRGDVNQLRGELLGLYISSLSLSLSLSLCVCV